MADPVLAAERLAGAAAPAGTGVRVSRPETIRDGVSGLSARFARASRKAGIFPDIPMGSPVPKGDGTGRAVPPCMLRAKLGKGDFLCWINALCGVTAVTGEVTPQAVDLAGEIVGCHAVTLPAHAYARAHLRAAKRDSVTRGYSLEDRRGYACHAVVTRVTWRRGGRR